MSMPVIVMKKVTSNSAGLWVLLIKWVSKILLVAS